MFLFPSLVNRGAVTFVVSMRAWGALLVAGCLVARRADALLCPAGLPRGPLRAFAPCQRREPCVRAAEGSIADAEGAVGVHKDKYEMRKRQVAYMVHQLARIGAGCCAFGCVRACKRASERAFPLRVYLKRR